MELIKFPDKEKKDETVSDLLRNLADDLDRGGVKDLSQIVCVLARANNRLDVVLLGASLAPMRDAYYLLGCAQAGIEDSEPDGS